MCSLLRHWFCRTAVQKSIGLPPRGAWRLGRRGIWVSCMDEAGGSASHHCLWSGKEGKMRKKWLLTTPYFPPPLPLTLLLLPLLASLLQNSPRLPCPFLSLCYLICVVLLRDSETQSRPSDTTQAVVMVNCVLCLYYAVLAVGSCGTKTNGRDRICGCFLRVSRCCIGTQRRPSRRLVYRCVEMGPP